MKGFRFVRRVAVLLLVAVVGGCDVLTPSENEIPGAYDAVALTTAAGTTTFTSDEDGAPDLRLVLHEDGTTTGYAYLPNGLGNGPVIDIDLAGTWIAGLEGVVLDLVTPSFLEELYFNRNRDLLVGDGGSPRVVLELSRVD